MMFLQGLTWLIFLGFSLRRLMTYLHLFQQEDYDPKRFLLWVFQTRSFDRKLSLCLVVGWLIFIQGYPLIAWGLTVFLMAGFMQQEKDPRKTAKKPLVLTKRARRILYTAVGITGASTAALLLLGAFPLWGWVLAVQALPCLLVAANIALMPFEWRIQRRFWNEARTRLLAVNPTVIGITGSFGKTSVKHLLGHVLKTHARTYYAKGSINSPMGISRAIREEMQPDCRFFVSEMGAYQRGSIARVCALTPPKHGIITALGAAHYERFKTLETVAKAKFEMAETVVKSGGKVAVPESLLNIPYASEFIQKHRASFLICGASKEADARIVSQEQTVKGTRVTVTWQGNSHDLEAPLWGAHQAQNIALVFAMAMNLGLSPEQVTISLKTAPQTKHRQEVKPQPDGSIYIDDAYKSNPAGFASALDTLALLRPEGGRRILVTPGMIEMGEKHDEDHAALGLKAASCVDIALVVGAERIPTFVAALAPVLGENLLRFPGFSQAADWLRINVRPGDIVLLENDLLDLYEKKLSF
ncbi:MAG: UDP-N-acetylmuramoyl-tripeptide--D-alanyl-D-alanine ligase [Pseudomonadota bacterium]